MKNYKTIYKKYFEIKSDYVIHHIDHNKRNNDITNLVSIPENIHAGYHYYHNSVKNIKNILKENIYTRHLLINDIITIYDRYRDYLKDINDYIVRKDIFLLKEGMK